MKRRGKVWSAVLPTLLFLSMIYPAVTLRAQTNRPVSFLAQEDEVSAYVDTAAQGINAVAKLENPGSGSLFECEGGTARKSGCERSEGRGRKESELPARHREPTIPERDAALARGGGQNGNADLHLRWAASK